MSPTHSVVREGEVEFEATYGKQSVAVESRLVGERGQQLSARLLCETQSLPTSCHVTHHVTGSQERVGVAH